MPKKKCRKKWRGGLKETIELMLIRRPQLQFFEDGIKITATDTSHNALELQAGLSLIVYTTRTYLVSVT